MKTTIDTDEREKQVKEYVELHNKLVDLLDDVPLECFIAVAGTIAGVVINDSYDTQTSKDEAIAGYKALFSKAIKECTAYQESKDDK